MQQAPSGVPSMLIWTLGLGLIVADSATSPYWLGVFAAVASGHAPSSAPAGQKPFAGVWRTAGLFLMLALLVLLSEAFPSGGSFAVTFLIAAWVLWLLANQQALGTFLGKFQ